jgi:hypothetical protein
MTTKYQHEQFGDLIATDISSEEPKLPEVLALLYSGDGTGAAEAERDGARLRSHVRGFQDAEGGMNRIVCWFLAVLHLP